MNNPVPIAVPRHVVYGNHVGVSRCCAVPSLGAFVVPPHQARWCRIGMKPCSGGPVGVVAGAVIWAPLRAPSLAAVGRSAAWAKSLISR